MLVSNWRSVVIGLWATRILNGCRMREMFSDMPFMYGIVAVVVWVASSLASVVVGLWVLRWIKWLSHSWSLGHLWLGGNFKIGLKFFDKTTLVMMGRNPIWIVTIPQFSRFSGDKMFTTDLTPIQNVVCEVFPTDRRNPFVSPLLGKFPYFFSSISNNWRYPCHINSIITTTSGHTAKNRP